MDVLTWDVMVSSAGSEPSPPSSTPGGAAGADPSHAAESHSPVAFVLVSQDGQVDAGRDLQHVLAETSQGVVHLYNKK